MAGACFGATLVVSAALCMGGCRAVAPDLADTNLTGIELLPATRGYYRDIHVERIDHEIAIRGHVRRLIEPGHIRVELLSRDRHVLAEDRVAVSRPLRSSRVRYATFAARLPVPLTPASVKITHDRLTRADQN